ncbi:MAG: cation transporter [Flavobacteriales bacterium]|nr:cation transporter [Flavobacteriales bacterium]
MEHKNILLPLSGVESQHCATRVEKALHAVPTIADAYVDLPGKVAVLNANTPADTVRQAVGTIRSAGYEVITEQRAFKTANITCGGCSNSATNLLNKLPGVLDIRIDVGQRTADIEVVKGALTDTELINALKPAGYDLLLVA